jgi:multimeric flavodoxin WrbA
VVVRVKETHGQCFNPFKDERDMIIHEMIEADGIVMATPVYSHMVSATMKNFFDRFGFNMAPVLELHFRPGKMPEKNIIKNREKTIEAVNTLIARIEKGEKDKPSLSMMVPFHLFKYLSIIDK